MKFGDKTTLRPRKVLPKSKTRPSLALWTIKDGDIKLTLEYKPKEVIYIGIWETNNIWRIIWNLEEGILQMVSANHFDK